MMGKGMMGPGRPQRGPPLLGNELEDVHHGVSAMLEVEGAKDMPQPRTEAMKDVMISILTEDGSKELRKIGFFATSSQAGQLVSVDCKQTRVFVQAPLHFGGDAQEGAQYIKVAISYGKKSGGVTDTELIGMTDAIKVGWKPVAKTYHEIRQPQTRKVLGGVYLTHRLVTEAEAAGQRSSSEENHQVAAKRRPQVGPPIEPLQRVSGRTGNFPPGSQEEAFEQATLNCESQNRALLQRVKKADPANHEADEGHVRVVNGYRQWDSMDSLFHSMGPNPLAMSDELGPAVARGYQHTSSLAKEVGPRLQPAMSPADQTLNLEMLRMMTKEDPSLVHAVLRPILCKDPHEIAGPRDMSWCPDPPVYAPMHNMTDADRETLRLACYEPTQSAALNFVDVNPNYSMNEDIWAVLHDYKSASAKYMPRPTGQRRVKDDCIMA